jgi:Uma2 family endonuclease
MIPMHAIADYTTYYATYDDTPREDHVVFLSGLTWDDYERLLDMRGDHSAPRISYLKGTVEILSPSQTHEGIKSVIGRLVETYCAERGIEFSTYGAWTLKDEPRERGAEPDECWIFGTDDAERPHLVIDVVWTAGRIDKLDIYRQLGVREVWYWQKGKLQPYCLRGGRYETVARSEVLPGLDLALLTRFIAEPTTSAAIRGFRAALAPGR